MNALLLEVDQQRCDTQADIADQMTIDGQSDAAWGNHLKYTHPAYVQAYVAELNRRIAANEVRTGNQGEILWGEAAVSQAFGFGYADEF